LAVKVHGFEVRSETGNGGMVRDKVNTEETEEAAVEAVLWTYGHRFTG